METFTVDPARFSIDELEAAARGESVKLTAPKAVVVLRAKLGNAATERLVGIAATNDFDLRARQVAIQQLTELPDTGNELRQLAQIADERIASLAREALRE
ncbi:hypothetical protein AB0346_16245 [Nocardia beijingensis]|uniref:hypothetical protein n=1 Tax=Nocardia beijingensis TaxID=95162 RepID=UPI00344E0DD1